MALSPFGQLAALKKAGFVDTNEMKIFGEAIKANPSVFALSNAISKDNTIDDETQKKFLTALGKQWKDDKTVFTRMEADLALNPALAEQYRDKVKSNPDGLIAELNNKYKPVLQQASPSAETTQPTPSAPFPMATVAGIGTPKPAPATSASPQQPASGRTSNPTTENDDLLEAVANASDDDIKKTTSIESIHLMADKLSKMAVDKYGINPATANGFATKIKTDPKLAQDIATNLQNNPEFVRQMAKMAKDNTPLSKSEKQMAQSEMNKLMANPQLLADPKYVQETQQKIQLAEQFKKDGFMGFFKSMFGGAFGGGLSGMGGVFASFSGPYSVFSTSYGGGMFPSFMVNLDNMHRNQAAAVGWNAANPRDMSTLAMGGQFFKDVPAKDQNGQPVMKDGKPVIEKVPNTIDIKTADGKTMKIIPAVGVLVAGQEAGRFDPDTKQFVAGNWRVPVVAAISESGDPTAIKKIVMTPTEFAKYQAEVNALAATSGQRQLASDPYTAQDALAAQRRAESIQLAKVDPQTGTVTQTVAGMAVQSGQVRKPNTASPSQERDYELQG